MAVTRGESEEAPASEALAAFLTSQASEAQPQTLKLSEHLSEVCLAPPPGLETVALPTLLGKSKGKKNARKDDPKGLRMANLIRTQEGAQAICAQLASFTGPLLRNFHGELVTALLPDLPSLACDPHATQVVHHLITCDDEAYSELSRKMVRRLRGSLLKLTKDKHGCWVVQQALQCVPTELHALLSMELRGKVLACSQHLHGNFVLQKCVELLNHGHVAFIVDELKHHAVEAALHIYSCRVLQRIIEHCPHDGDSMTELLNTLLNKDTLHRLVMDPYGNNVLRAVLARGRPRHLKQIARVFTSDECNVLVYARNRHSSLVMERCLETMGGELRHELKEERDALMAALLGSDDVANPPFTQMALDRFGNYIAQRAMEECQGDEQQRVLHLLGMLGPKLRRAVNGRHILQAARRKFGSQLAIHVPSSESAP
mmetsp:Transcript_52771/g.98826  ORF Transcript_52771/g.98826 Transcript_52771/m.98826 type:complete len:430 (+) Transcript_52771:103-1392(+)